MTWRMNTLEDVKSWPSVVMLPTLSANPGSVFGGGGGVEAFLVAGSGRHFQIPH